MLQSFRYSVDNSTTNFRSNVFFLIPKILTFFVRIRHASSAESNQHHLLYVPNVKVNYHSDSFYTRTAIFETYSRVSAFLYSLGFTSSIPVSIIVSPPHLYNHISQPLLLFKSHWSLPPLPQLSLYSFGGS